MFVLTSAKIRRSIQKRMNESYPDLTFSFHESMSEAESELSKAEILITYGDDLTEKLVKKAEQLKWIMVISAGVENLPFQAIKDQDILVTNARGIHKIPMAEYTIGMMINAVKNAKTWYENQRIHEWDKSMEMGEISGKTVAVLGSGAIGGEIARISKAFNMKTIGMNRSGHSANFFDETYSNDQINQCVADADFVVAVLPHTDETEKMIGRDQFLAMKKSSIFMNIGRGSTVNQDDLLEALREEQIALAILDVFEEEPLPVDHPFWEMPQVTVTPHLSAISPKYQHRAFEIFEQNLKTFKDNGDDYRNQIDYERGY